MSWTGLRDRAAAWAHQGPERDWITEAERNEFARGPVRLNVHRIDFCGLALFAAMMALLDLPKHDRARWDVLDVIAFAQERAPDLYRALVNVHRGADRPGRHDSLKALLEEVWGKSPRIAVEEADSFGRELEEKDRQAASKAVAADLRGLTARESQAPIGDGMDVFGPEPDDECCDGIAYCREHNPGGKIA